MVVPIDDSDNLHIQLRNKFFENLNVKQNYDDYEEVDLDRLKNDDNYCKRFILHKRGNFDEALLMADEALKWRKSFGVKDVNQAAIPNEFFQAKAVFPYNKDREGKPIILILTRYHKKAPEFAEALRRFVIYWVELMEEQTKGGQMTVIMSCVGAGLSNLDLDLIKFLITLFRSYYPHSLAHILIFEMPWILNPAWKIIKAWLPEDFVDKIKFVNKTSILEYVSEDNLPVDMGGTDTTEYEPPSLDSNANNNVSPTETKRNGNEYYAGSKHSQGKSHLIVTDDYTIAGGLLKICPASELCFSPTEPTRDVVIKLTCVSEKPISYKVKTNNIESYRVKPSIGIIEPGSSIEINVILLQDFHPLPSDKFLIMAMEVPDPKMSTSDLNTLWKNSKSEAVTDHKLKCVTGDQKNQKSEKNETVDIAQSLQNINLLLSNIDAKVQSLHAKQSSLQFQQIISLFLTGVLFLLVFLQTFFSADSRLNFSFGFL